MKENLNIKNLKDMLNKTYDLYKDKVAYKIKKDNKYILYTHKDLRDRVNYLGTALIHMGYKDKKIGVIGSNSMNWEISYLAAVCGVGVVVPIDKTLPIKELEHVVETSGVSLIFSFSEKVDDLKIILKENNNLEKVVCLDNKEFDDLLDLGKLLLEEGNTEYLDAEINSSDMASMLFTSGTTSKSKVVALSHENLCFNITDLSLRMGIDSNDIFLSVLPVHHAFECTFGFLLPIYLGATITFGDGIRHIIDNLKEYQVSVMACVPALYENILKNINRNLAKLGVLDEYLSTKDKYSEVSMDDKKKIFKEVHNMLGDNIKYFISGAAYLNENIERDFRDYGINLMQGYGLTETSPVVCMCSSDNYKLGSVGKCLNNVKAKIINPKSDGVGELAVKGKSIMLGYLEKGKYNRDSFDDDYFLTGDLARIDKDGYIFICGRKKDTIVLNNGKNIYPEEIEYLINKVDGVKESLIFSLTKDKCDVKIEAKIVYDRSVMIKDYNAFTDEDIYAALFKEIKKINKTIPEYKAIKNIILTEKPLVRTTTNKIKRQESILDVKMA